MSQERLETNIKKLEKVTTDNPEYKGLIEELKNTIREKGPLKELYVTPESEEFSTEEWLELTPDEQDRIDEEDSKGRLLETINHIPGGEPLLKETIEGILKEIGEIYNQEEV